MEPRRTHDMRLTQLVFSVNNRRPGDPGATRDRLREVRSSSSDPINTALMNARMARFYEQNVGRIEARPASAGDVRSISSSSTRVPESIRQHRYRAPSHSNREGEDETMEERNARVAHQNARLRARHSSIPTTAVVRGIMTGENQTTPDTPTQPKRSETSRSILNHGRGYLGKLRRWFRGKFDMGIAEKHIPQSRYGPGVGAFRHRHTYGNDLMLIDDDGTVKRDYFQGWTPQAGGLFANLDRPIYSHASGRDHARHGGPSSAFDIVVPGGSAGRNEPSHEVSRSPSYSDFERWIRENSIDAEGYLPVYDNIAVASRNLGSIFNDEYPSPLTREMLDPDIESHICECQLPGGNTAHCMRRDYPFWNL